MGQAHIVMIACVALAGCGALPPHGCNTKERLVVNEMLYFGTAMDQGVVSPEQWADFVGETVSPRFPGGFTTWPASGQWVSANGAVVREPSHVLVVDHPDDARSDFAIREIMNIYKKTFHQEGVLRARSLSCTSF